jgi:hypothetical protein
MEFLNLDHNVRDPEECGSLNPNDTTLYKQATIYCNECQGYQKLNTRNSIHATPPFNAKKCEYYGLCYTKSCLEQIQEKAREKRIDDLFFAQEKYLMSRCDLADAKCDAFDIKHGIGFGDQADADAKFLETEKLHDLAYDELMDIKKTFISEKPLKK